MWHDAIAKLASNAVVKVMIKLPPRGITLGNTEYAYTVKEQKMRVYAELLRRHKPWFTTKFAWKAYAFDKAGNVKTHRLLHRYPQYALVALKARELATKEMARQIVLLWLTDILGDQH